MHVENCLNPSINTIIKSKKNKEAKMNREKRISKLFLHGF